MTLIFVRRVGFDGKEKTDLAKEARFLNDDKNYNAAFPMPMLKKNSIRGSLQPPKRFQIYELIKCGKWL